MKLRYKLSLIFLGITLVLILCLTILYFMFTPLFSWEEDKGKITILGGVIEIDTYGGKVKFFDEYFFFDNSYPHNFKGQVDPKLFQNTLYIPINEGTFHIETSFTPIFEWDCQIERKPDNHIVSQESNRFSLLLNQYGNSSCHLKVPSNIKLYISGINGQFTLEEPDFPVSVTMKNATISFEERDDTDYCKDIQIEQSNMRIKTPCTPKSHLIKIDLEKGSIEQ